MLLRDEILQQALNLRPDDRAYLADLLEQSLPVVPVATPEIAAAWSQEIARRVAAYDRGETTAVDFETALEHVRQALVVHRAHRDEP